MKQVRLLTLICISILLAGCVATAKGTLYKSTPEPKASKAQVVVYSNPTTNTMVPEINMMDNKESVGTFINGEYLIYNTYPGKHRLWGDSQIIDSPVEVTLEAGKTYYFRYTSKFIPYASRSWLRAVKADEATAELASCCLDGIEVAK